MASDRALGAHAETAQELAAALIEFKPHVQEAAREITALVSEFYAISASLQELKSVCSDPRSASENNLIAEDKYVLLRSLEHTFKDLDRFIKLKDRPAVRTRREVHKDIWAQIDTYFRNESGNQLLTRMGYYKQFTDELVDVVEG
jgi:hypothetical protein